jgi:hypothetical protein
MRLTPRNTQFYDMFTAAASNALDAALMLTEVGERCLRAAA